MDDISALTDPERAFLVELTRRGVRFMIVGLGAAVLQGANTSTKDIDLWFEQTSDPRIREAAAAVGGVWVSGSFGMRPPQLGGRTGDEEGYLAGSYGNASCASSLPSPSKSGTGAFVLRTRGARPEK